MGNRINSRFWLEIECSLAKSIGDRDEKVSREALVAIRWKKAESERPGRHQVKEGWEWGSQILRPAGPSTHTCPNPCNQLSKLFFNRRPRDNWLRGMCHKLINYHSIQLLRRFGELPLASVKATTWTHDIIEVQLKSGFFTGWQRKCFQDIQARLFSCFTW